MEHRIGEKPVLAREGVAPPIGIADTMRTQCLVQVRLTVSNLLILVVEPGRIELPTSSLRTRCSLLPTTLGAWWILTHGANWGNFGVANKRED
jgi:hypothetical protein